MLTERAGASGAGSRFISNFSVWVGIGIRPRLFGLWRGPGSCSGRLSGRRMCVCRVHECLGRKGTLQGRWRGASHSAGACCENPPNPSRSNLGAARESMPTAILQQGSHMCSITTASAGESALPEQLAVTGAARMRSLCVQQGSLRPGPGPCAPAFARGAGHSVTSPLARGCLRFCDRVAAAPSACARLCSRKAASGPSGERYLHQDIVFAARNAAFAAGTSLV